MPRASLQDLLERNGQHVEALRKAGVSSLPDDQRPPVVSVCCSDSRVLQAGMWSVEEPGWLFTVGTIGNQAWRTVEGERVVAGSVAYPLNMTETGTVAVVGHTGCGAVSAALSAFEGDRSSLPGVRSDVESLVPLVEGAYEVGTVSGEEDRAVVRDVLVEVNVHAQAAFLERRGEVPDDVDVFGFVYDVTGAYGGPAGRAYVVRANGVHGEEALRGLAGDRVEHVASLLGDRTWPRFIDTV